ncbi:biotin--[acetyl-CoA-carboxylase] ligase [Atopobacter phocae]|uniref:biotin--[acetyl-CoA-carboxylase] ligase n=1 Tax=Atopobacter phocae TaxID=136492 RepID=UPI0004706106|nr:biotin--[acetyl-CoA-carboxylase] ligase [Atopobacter phocae]
MQLKEALRSYFLTHQNEVISGADLGRELNVSRNAIWKVINQLKEELPIESIAKSGYRLSFDPSLLHDDQLRLAFQNQKVIPNHVLFTETIDSTNSYAKNHLFQQDFPSIIVSNEQTAGRGRYQREFLSPAQTGIYLTISFKMLPHFTDAGLITTAAAVAVRRAITSLYHIDLSIKWVNDLFLHSKKVAGILTEATTNLESGTIDSVFLGIGLNLLPLPELPNELSHIVGSLFPESLPESFNRLDLVLSIWQHFWDIIQNDHTFQFLKEYKAACFLIGQRIQYSKHGTTYTGIAVDIDQRGNLIVEDENHTRDKLYYGEVQLLKK